MTIYKKKYKGIRLTDVRYKLHSLQQVSRPMLIWTQRCLPMYALPRPSLQCQPPPAPASSQSQPEQTKTLSYQHRVVLDFFFLNKTRAVCSKKGGWQHLQRTYLEKKQQFCCAKRKKRCVNFISRLKSWVNYVRLSSNSAKQLFVYLGPPWVSGPYACLVCKPGHTGQDPASLTETRDCVCGSVCACVVCVCVHLLQLKRLV